MDKNKYLELENGTLHETTENINALFKEKQAFICLEVSQVTTFLSL